MRKEKDKKKDTTDQKDQIKVLQEKLDEYQKKAQEYLEGWKRAQADLINYQREVEKREAELIEFANVNLILEILNFFENLERTIKNLPQEFKNHNWTKGLLNTYRQLKEMLKKWGVEKISTKDCKFDPHFHEIVEMVDKKEKAKGMILEEISPGYTLKGKVIKPAKVKVAN